VRGRGECKKEGGRGIKGREGKRTGERKRGKERGKGGGAEVSGLVSVRKGAGHGFVQNRICDFNIRIRCYLFSSTFCPIGVNASCVGKGGGGERGERAAALIRKERGGFRRG
jgi:hypothetical protein